MPGPNFQTIGDLFTNAVEKYPQKTAFIGKDGRLTYAEAAAQSGRLAEALRTRCQVRAGQTVAVALPNCLEYGLIYWALMKLGGIFVPVNFRLGAEELRFILDSTEASVCFVDHSTWPAIKEVRPPQLRQVVAVGFEEAGLLPYAELPRQGERRPGETTLAPPKIRTEDPAIIMHTSGTTGRPKGATMRHCDLLFNVRLALLAHSFRHEDVHLLVIPMFHATASYSLLPASAYLGSTIVIADTNRIGEICALIQEHRCTTWMSVPTLCQFLVSMEELEAYELGSLRLLAYAGSRMPPETIRRLRQRLPAVALHNFFGLTETISMTHVLPSAEAVTHADSIGKVLPEVRQAILDPAGKPLPPGEVGELCFGVENVVCGYWKQPGLLEQSLKDGWFHTGDLAMMDADGYVYLRGRAKELIIVAGENVYADEVERVIQAHEKVQEAAVVGVEATGPWKWMGELVKAVVVPREEESLTALEIKRHCAERLAAYKVPALVEFRQALPRNTLGKVIKRMLQ